ncbi:MAG TPA: hypothetical protein VGM87_13730 [Roseomonas sp.]|jgi:hypothetical protein
MPSSLLLSLLILLAACAPRGAEVAADAKRRLVGMNADDLRACAGIPNRTLRLGDGSELLSYEQQNGNVGGLNITVPVVGGGFRLAGSGSYCHALFRVSDGRVASLAYTGDSDDIRGQDGVCAPIVRGCLRQLDNAPGDTGAPGAEASPP